MYAETTVVTYEPCGDCTDGSCGQCGAHSGEHAGPGVKLVVRRLRFVRCQDCQGKGCDKCGSSVHLLAASGIATELVSEHATKRWVPSIHFAVGDKPRCGGWVPHARLTSKKKEVTCRLCLKFIGARR